MMAGRKHKTTVNLDEAKATMVAVKTLIVSLGLPYAKVRTIDDAISVIEQLEGRNKNV